MAEFVYLVHPLRQGFFESPTALEAQVVEAHFESLKPATEEGMVRLAGQCLDDTFGVVVLAAESAASCAPVHTRGTFGEKQSHDGRSAPDEGVLMESR